MSFSHGETPSGTKRLRPTDQGTDDESVRALARLKDLKRAMGSVTSIAFTSDGLWLATSGASFEDQPLDFDYTGPLPDPKTTGRVKVWNAESGKRKFDFDHHLSAGSIAISRSTGASGDYFNCILATAGSWKTGNQRFSGVRLWRMGDGNLVQELRNEDEDFPSSIACSPDSVLLAIGRKHRTNANGETCGIVRMVKPLAGVVWEQTVPISARRVVFVANGNMLAVLCGRPGQEQSIQLLDANTGKLKRELKLADLSHGGAWVDFAYSASEQLLIAVGRDKENRGIIDVWDFENRKVEAREAVVLEPNGSFQGHWTTKQGYWIACHYPTALEKADKADPGSLAVRLGIVHGGPLHPGPSAVSAEDLQIISQMWLVVRDGDRVISRARLDRELDHGNEEHYIATINATADLVPKMAIEFEERRKSGTQRYRIPVSTFINRP